jgi:integrase
MAFKRVQVEKGIRQVGPDRLEVQVFVGRDPVTQKMRFKSATTTKGIADARRLRARLMTEVDQGKHGGTTGSLGSLLSEWLATSERLGHSPNTIAENRRKIEKVIRPELGAVRIDKVTPHTLDAFYGRLLDGGTSPATVLAYHRILAAALHQGERWGWIDRNPARLATPPSVPKKTLHVPPPERVRELIDRAASSRNPDNATLITFAALSGLRRGELCALRWADIDWIDSAITVSRALWQTPNGWGVKDPKTHQVRRLLLGDATLAVLRLRWTLAQARASDADIELVRDAYVFSSVLDGTEPTLPSTVTHAFTRLCKQAENDTASRLHIKASELPAKERWPYRFHDLRHYTATELFREGHHARTVADRLGHADPALTLRIYTHDTEDQARAAALSIEGGILAHALSLPGTGEKL